MLQDGRLCKQCPEVKRAAPDLECQVRPSELRYVNTEYRHVDSMSLKVLASICRWFQTWVRVQFDVIGEAQSKLR